MILTLFRVLLEFFACMVSLVRKINCEEEIKSMIVCWDKRWEDGVKSFTPTLFLVDKK